MAIKIIIDRDKYTNRFCMGLVLIRWTPTFWF